MSELYVGLMSGTSLDGLDAALVEFGDSACRIRLAATTAFPADLHDRLRALVTVPRVSLRELGTLDNALGRFSAECCLDLLERAGCAPADVIAIGHHGHTVYHHPGAPGAPGAFSMQIGDPNAIAARTGIATVADFRRADMALGGQGAPLAPAFHAWQFHNPREARAVVNIGGIANVTLLAPGRPPIGFDTGPGNTLLDLWIHRSRGGEYDDEGRWSASGQVDAALLSSFLAEPFFALSPPKSTGREHFNTGWVEQHLAGIDARPSDVDVQATLAALTATTIGAAVARSTAACERVIVCGGGAHNADLVARLRRATGTLVESSDAHGIGPDWVEAAAFAWLARARVKHMHGNLPSVTGARRAAVLGGVYCTRAP